LNKLDELRINFEYSENIAYSGPFVGEESDYEILWKKHPTTEETFALVKHLDKIFANFDCKYSISTEISKGEDVLTQIKASKSEDIAFTFVRLIGPSISQAIEMLNKHITDFPSIKAITGELIGRYDYAFEWVRIPEVTDIIHLSDMMDRFLAETGVIYNITTKSKLGTIQIPQLKRDLDRGIEKHSDLIQFVVNRYF
jgi:hypothetical protein